MPIYEGNCRVKQGFAQKQKQGNLQDGTVISGYQARKEDAKRAGAIRSKWWVEVCLLVVEFNWKARLKSLRIYEST